MFDRDSPRKYLLNVGTLFGSICGRGSERRSWGIEANVQRIDAKATSQKKDDPSTWTTTRERQQVTSMGLGYSR